MAETDVAVVDLNHEKEGRRLRALRECFHRALKLALDCPTWEVIIKALGTKPVTLRDSGYALCAGVCRLLQRST